MPMDIYVPNNIDIIHSTKVDFRKRISQQEVHLVQYDRSLAVVEVELFYNGYSYTCPNNAEVWIRWSKPDRTYVYKICQVSSDRKKIYFDVDYQMSCVQGELNPILELQVGQKLAGSSPIPVTIDRNPIQNGDRESHVEDMQVEILREEVAELREEIENINLKNATYAELRTLKDNNQLLPGQVYRITDFVTTTAQPRTQSANHPFDLIIKAISTNKFSEIASAIIHDGDTYFANSKLEGWVIRYCFDNDTSRFAWADATNGKGVIYYLEDEFDNICFYDFKNIQFARYKITACEKATSLVGKYLGIVDVDGNNVLSDHMTIDIEDARYYYTFDCCGTDYSLNNIGQTLTRSDGSTFTLDQIQCQHCYIDVFSHDSAMDYLNNITCILEGSRDLNFKTGWDSRDSVLIGGVTAYSIKSHISKTIIGCTGTTYLDGYVAQFADSDVLERSLIIIENYGCCFNEAEVFTIVASTLVTSTANIAMIYYSKVEYIGFCNLKSVRTILENSSVDLMANCTLTSGARIFYFSNIHVVQACNGDVNTVYCGYATADYMYNISINLPQGEKPDWFINIVNCIFITNTSFSEMNNTSLRRVQNCTFKSLQNCTITDVRNVTCNQNLQNCNLDDVRYTTISSSNTSQNISNTGFHNIRGASDNVKNLVINEDYSVSHTVNIYGSGTKEIILD